MFNILIKILYEHLSKTARKMPRLDEVKVEDIGWHKATISWDVIEEEGSANLSHFKVDLSDGDDHHVYITKG